MAVEAFYEKPVEEEIIKYWIQKELVWSRFMDDKMLLWQKLNLIGDNVCQQMFSWS